MKQILFNTEMVRAILDGRKTVTRRVVKTNKYIPYDAEFGYSAFTPDGHISVRGHFDNYEYGENFIKLLYRKGDILYVRETWRVVEYLEGLSMKFEYAADGKVSEFIDFTKDRLEKFLKYINRKKWCPNIFMPKEAARIFLRVTDVRVERLQDITAEQILDEGVDVKFPEPKPGYISLAYTEMMLKPAARKQFANLWDGTIKKGDIPLYGWATNPWVFVIQFEQISREEAENEPIKHI